MKINERPESETTHELGRANHGHQAASGKFVVRAPGATCKPRAVKRDERLVIEAATPADVPAIAALLGEAGQFSGGGCSSAGCMTRESAGGAT